MTRKRAVVLDPVRVSKYAALCGMARYEDFERACLKGLSIKDTSEIPSNAWNGRKVDGNKARQIASLLGLPSYRLLLSPCHDDIEYPEARDWMPNSHPPGALLKAEYGVVPFHYRDKELDDLDDWCRSGERLAIRLYTGLGGMGKTRLAIEQCHRLERRDNWVSGFLKEVSFHIDTENRFVWLKDEVRSAFVVIDYAETRRVEVVGFIKAAMLSENQVRIILLARAAAGWWSTLKTESKGIGDLLMGNSTSWVSLRPLSMVLDQREYSYRLAANSFAKYLGVEISNKLPKNLMHDYYQQALILHMQALIDLDGESGESGLQGILEVVLSREKKFWESQLKSYQLPMYILPCIGILVARITNAGGVKLDDDPMKVFDGVPDLIDMKSYQRKVVLSLLHDIYPGSGSAGGNSIEPLRPDLLGEYLIQDEMTRDYEVIADYIDYQ